MTRWRRVLSASLLLAAAVVGATVGCSDEPRCCPIGGSCNGFSLGGPRVNGQCDYSWQDVDPTGGRVVTDEHGCAVLVPIKSCLDFDAGGWDTGADVGETAEASRAETPEAGDDGVGDALSGADAPDANASK